MDEKRFLEILDEIAYWERPKVGPNGAKSVVKKAKELDEDGNEIEPEWTDGDRNNDSIAPVITKLKEVTEICNDCGQSCNNRRIVESRITQKPIPHWRTKCLYCKAYKNPNTGEFNLVTNQEIQDSFRKYFVKRLKE